MSRRYHLSVIFAFAFIFSGCDKAPPPKTADEPAPKAASVAMRAVEPASSAMPSGKPMLRDVLPDSAYAYVRVPSTWGVVGTPTGGAFDKAVGSAPYVAAVRAVREGFAATVVPELPEEKLQFLARLFLQHATSPIEAAVLPAPDANVPMPDLLITAQVDFADIGALNAFLGSAAKFYPAFELVEPAQADAPGMLSVAGVPGQVQLDAAQSRLYLLLSAVRSPTVLADIRQTLRANDKHVMRTVEGNIDASGQGLFTWVNPPKLIELAGAMGGQNAMGPLLGLAAVKNLGAGIGTSGGIHRLKVVAEMPPNGFRAFMPVIADVPAAQAAGTPKMVAMIGLPSPDDLSSIESVAAMVNPEKMQSYQEFKSAFAAKLGFTVEDVFAALGQDVTFISDEAGQYLAVRLRDAQKFRSMVETSSQRFGLKYENRSLGGHTYHHLAVPSIDSVLADAVDAADDKEDAAKKIAMRFIRTPSHLYWVEEGNYLLVSSLPQVLIDRTYIAGRTPVNRWLEQQQRMDAHGALLLASGRNEGLPALMYQMNLGLLSYLGDVVERPVDMFALPTAREAALPEEGAFGLKLTSSDSQIGFELAFESNPMEILLGGNGYTGVAMVGVLAAIAVPAYNDYAIRAEVALGMAATKPVRSQLEQFVLGKRRFPNAKELDAFDLSAAQTDKYQVAVSPDDGIVILEFYRDGLGEDASVILVPEIVAGELNWVCSSEIAEKYLPQSCRE